MDLSNLSPAEGSVKSDNFRRGRGHGSRGSGRVGFSDFSFQHFQDETSDQTLMDIFKEAENYELFPNSSAV